MNLVFFGIIDLFIKGGPVMYVLLLCSFIGVYIIVQKLLFLHLHKIDRVILIERVKNQLVTIGAKETIAELELEKDLWSRVVCEGIKLSNYPEDQVVHGIRVVTLKELPELEKNMALLSSLVTIAPMLGLLGTILGLISIFHVISGGANWDPNLLSGGIAQALITTVSGLSVAVPLIFIYQFLNQKIDAHVIEIERIMLEILTYCKTTIGVKP